MTLFSRRLAADLLGHATPTARGAEQENAMKRFVIASVIGVAALAFGAGAAGATMSAAPTPPTVRIGDAVQIGEGAVLTAPVGAPSGAQSPSGTSSSGPLQNTLLIGAACLGVALVGAAAYRRSRRNPVSVPATALSDLILVVDDEPAFRRSVARMLTESGYNVREADDGVTALDAINAGLRPALVLTDVAMPGVSGTDLSTRLKEQGIFNTVLMSGLDLPPDSPPFLRKPFREGELLSVVRRELVGATA
ncbi:MAG: putative two-component hybrid sensor and regulator [Actinomycetia bacterium]|nr:putative two-component hybrid sensor and regulator [Actinomycetes bacterium]